MSTPKRVHLSIAGRVQGVGFRYSAVHQAQRLGLRGWVRNTRDGRVETVAEGDAAAVDAYVTWCRRGPSLARVTDCRATVQRASGEFRSFDVRY